MEFRYVPMNEAYASTIKSNWHYSGEYAVYDYANDDCIDDPHNWDNVFAVLDSTNSDELVGEITLYFEDGELWVGCGLKPELTGQGLGVAFLQSGLQFGIAHFQYKGEFVKLAVMKANLRAITVYQRVGFKIYDEYSAEIESKTHEFWKLRYALPQP